MRTTRQTLRLFIAFSFILLLSGQHYLFAAENPPSVFRLLDDFFPLQEGNEWTYSVEENGTTRAQTVRIEGREDVEGVEAIKINFGDGDVDYTVSVEEGLQRCRYLHPDGTTRRFFKPKAVVWPRTVSMHTPHLNSFFYTDFTKEGAYVRTVDQFIVFELMGLEDVEVPAGKFKGCLKIMYIENFIWVNPDTYLADPATEQRNHINILWFAKNKGIVKCISIVNNAFHGKIKSSRKTMELKNARINGRAMGSAARIDKHK